MGEYDSPLPPETGEKKTILVVDDTKENLTVIGELLQPYFRVRVANSGERALRVARSDPRPDLILLDVMMPEMDGYAVLVELRSDPATRDIPVIFVTAMDGDEDEEYGLSLGAVDYITKPIRLAILLARIRTQLELAQARNWLRNQNGYLEQEVLRRMRENELIKDISLNALALLAEKRDSETGNHLHRTQAYVEALMDTLQGHPRFTHALTPRQRPLIAKAAPLHDIGKVGIPDHILLKPGKLTPEEFEIMKQHSRIGATAIDDAIQRVWDAPADHSRLDGPLAFLEVARQIALGHHEKWDGSGYPQGLAGDDIPVPARLMALADVFDALTCRRHYKPAFAMEQAVAIIREGRGRHFDPDVVDAFLALQDTFAAIARRYADDA
jgi:putative two-component system response regulator